MRITVVLIGVVAWISCEYVGGRRRASPATAFWLPKAGLIFAILCVFYGVVDAIGGL
jgi:hypothetical protein